MAPWGDSHRKTEVPKTIFRLRRPGQRHNLRERRLWYRANPGAGSGIKRAGRTLHPFPSMGLTV
jgi:hypothetical protein